MIGAPKGQDEFDSLDSLKLSGKRTGMQKRRKIVSHWYDDLI